MAAAPAWPIMAQGHTGINVSALQCLLNHRNNNRVLTVDGGFGPATHNAVIAHQKSHALVQDGKAVRTR